MKESNFMQKQPDKPTLPKVKEKPMLGAKTEGVLEFEVLNVELNLFLEAIDTLKNFAFSKEWLAWKSYENEPQSEKRDTAKQTVLQKLKDLNKRLDLGSSKINKEINFYMAEIERK